MTKHKHRGPVTGTNYYEETKFERRSGIDLVGKDSRRSVRVKHRYEEHEGCIDELTELCVGKNFNPDW